MLITKHDRPISHAPELALPGEGKDPYGRGGPRKRDPRADEAEANGISRHRYHRRIGSGWSHEDAITIPVGSVPKRAGKPEGGKSRYQEGIDRGIARKTIDCRVRRLGWSLERAMSEPVKKYANQASTFVRG